MKITVVTGFTENYHEYGKTFVDRFFNYWTADVNLICYVEKPIALKRGETFYLHNIPGYTSFMQRNNKPEYRGLRENKSWKPKEQANGYSYRHDALKFALQGFIPYHAAQHILTTQDLEGYLIWLDADVFAYNYVTHTYLKNILAGDVTYLGRCNAHSEIGFVGYKLPEAMPVIQCFFDYYHTDKIFELKEWHSAYVFDKALAKHKLEKNNLTPMGRGHVWFQSPLSLCLDHCKGKRKENGFSREVVKWKSDLEKKFGHYL